MNINKPIPQCNPHANYVSHNGEINTAIKKVLNGGRYILGDEVECFESEFAKFMDTAGAIGVASGTDAIEIALRACGVSQGDTVVTVSHTAVATVAAIERCGANPLFVDIDPNTYTMDPESLKQLLCNASFNIKAVIPVHLYGQPADLNKIAEICKKFKVKLIEDCAQAHGALLDGKKVGTLGDFGTFSFYPTKNLGAIGDGGILISNNLQLVEKAKLIRQYGWKERYISAIHGVNSRLDELQAAILRVKLKYLEKDNQRRREIASIYNESLLDTKLHLPLCRNNVLHVYHQYVVRYEKRDDLREKLQAVGVGTAIHYPVAVHQQPAYSGIPRPVALTNTESITGGVLSLPMYPELHNYELEFVIDAMKTILKYS